MRERAMSKFQDHCYHNSKQAHERLIGWYQDALKYLHALESQLSPLKFQLECQRQNVEKSLHQFSTELSHIHSYVQKIAAQKIRNDLSPEGQKMSRKITGLMEKLTKETERTKVTVGQNNDILRNVTLGLEGLEVVDTNPAAFAIGGSEGFFRPDCPGYY
jgi:ATP-dependent protease HslVU (ClpYQ) ATPase subunit